jgi:polyhydroxybutyrate depolymerase
MTWKLPRVPRCAHAPAAGMAVLLAACAGGRVEPGPPGALDSGLHELTVRHGALVRTYLVDMPPVSAQGRPLPVVLAFHGGGGNAGQFRGSNGLVQLGEREGFIVVHPEGTGVLGARSWNAGFCCGRAAELGLDDVGFVAALLDDLARRTPIDPQRIYATGHSNGGMIAYRLAAELPGRLAAIAPVGGARLADTLDEAEPIPLLHVHSRTDPRALYDGGLGPPFPGTDHRAQHPPVEEVIAQWRSRNGCIGEPSLVESRVAPPSGPDAGHRADHLAWRDCSRGRPVEFWRLDGPGHGWPGSPVGPLREALVGPSTEVLDAAEAAWAFFQEHRRR